MGEICKVSWLYNGLIALLDNVLGKRQGKVDEQAATQQQLFLKCITQPDSPVIVEHHTMRGAERERDTKREREREKRFWRLTPKASYLS